MSDLSKMTLAELFNQRAQWDLMSVPERAAWYDERDRRQAILDAAEGMRAACAMFIDRYEWDGRTSMASLHCAYDSAKNAIAAYQAAKGDRS